jgi:hypothetical protein
MTTRTLSRYGLLLSVTALVLATAAMVPRGAPANPTLPTSAETAVDVPAPVEFARRGLSLLEKEGGLAPEADTLKADALIMRAWNLQQAYPESCPSVWQLTQTLISQQQSPSQRLAVASLYLNSIDAAIESAMTPEGFEASWAVRQAVRADIERHRQDALGRIESDLKEALAAVSRPDGIRGFVDGDSARWSSLATELSATIEPLPDPPKSISDLTTSLGDKLAAIFEEMLAGIRNRLKDGAAALPEPKDDQASTEAQADSKIRLAADRGPVTRLAEDLDEIARMRESASVTSWIELAATLGKREGSKRLPEDGEDQLLAMEALRGKILEARALRYNMWAADTIFNADRRGADGLFLLGAIETRLLVSTVAASYSITEGKILNEIKNPFDRQVRIREMLGQSKKQIVEF